MITVLVKIILMASLLVIFYQDQKDRMVDGWFFLIISIGFSVIHITTVGWLQFGIHSAFNVGIVLCMLLILTGYIKLRFQTFNLQSVFGLGDMLFLVAIAIGFATISFITLLVFGLIFSLVLHIVLKRMNNSTLSRNRTCEIHDQRESVALKHTNKESQNRSETVPLAGYLALFFAGVLVVHWLGFYDHLYLM